MASIEPSIEIVRSSDALIAVTAGTIAVDRNKQPGTQLYIRYQIASAIDHIP
jgi:hypothetical protein